jgi:serine/threonine-protein kinase HipA
VLNGVPTAKKYYGGYETRLFKRAGEFIDANDRAKALSNLYRLFVLNCAIRNGDAHLKNFGITYSDVQGGASLAPIYDLITTTACIHSDVMALSLEGSKKWPDNRRLIKQGQNPRGSRDYLHQEDFWRDGGRDRGRLQRGRRYFNEKSKYPDIGDKILSAWSAGVNDSLGLGGAGMKLAS